MIPITATIITLNEEDRIGETVRSLAFCDEVLVVDAQSRDRTASIAVSLGARVMGKIWSGYSGQKNFAAEQATHDWILSIDADERPSIELANELSLWKRTGEGAALVQAVAMPRRAFYLGRWIRHSGWYPDWKIRLYHRRFARWRGDFVHEAIEVDGSVGRFRNDLLHFPFRSVSEHVARIDRYTSLAAEASLRAGRRGSRARLLLAPALSFLKTYVIKAGFLDGWQGLAIASMRARYVFLRELRILR